MRWARWAPLALICIGLPLGYATGLHRLLSLEALREYHASLAVAVARDELLAAVIYLLVYVAAVALSFPGASILTVAGGMLFGFAAGAILALVAATAGGTLVFLAARTSLGDLLSEAAGPRIRALGVGFRESGFRHLLFLRLVPLFPFWLVNLAAALFGVRILPYVAATAIGILPGTLIFAYFGHGLTTAIDREGPALSWELFVALALLGALVLLPTVIRHWRRWRS